MKFLLLAFFLVAIQIASVRSWGPDGHRIIGQIGWESLSPKAQNYITKFIGTNYTMADIAPFPDDFRATPQGNWSAPCHYCNLPKGATNFTMSYCVGCCVVKSIMNYTKILQSEIKKPFQCNYQTGVEPCALEFLIHYVGDSHQPLHVGYGYDEGGNSVKVKFMDKSTNLHHVWDTSMIEWWIYKGNWTDMAANLTAMIQADPNLAKKYLANMNPIEWADESFYYVRTDVYNYDGSIIKINGDDASEPNLKWDYYNHNIPIVQQRLIAAGLRLGQLLTNIIGF